MSFWSVPLMILMIGLTFGFWYAVYGLLVAFQSERRNVRLRPRSMNA